MRKGFFSNKERDDLLERHNPSHPWKAIGPFSESGRFAHSMSNVYITEPPTSAKAILHTTYGPIEIELWARECPQTCRNFIALAMEGAFDGTSFHRIVPGFCVQGGATAADRLLHAAGLLKEFHSRLRWTRRGLLGAVSLDARVAHPSEFFFSLSATPELDRDCTLFGKAVGETLFNMLRIGEVAVEENDTPIYKVFINRVEVTQNPFEDIIPRFFSKPTTGGSTDAKWPEIKEAKNKNPVSFRQDEDDSLTIKPKAIESKEEKTPPTPVSSVSRDRLDEIHQAKQARIQAVKADIARLQRELSEQPAFLSTKAEDVAPPPPPPPALNSVEGMREGYRHKRGIIMGKRRADEEAIETMLTLTTFRKKLHSQSQAGAHFNADDGQSTKDAIAGSGKTVVDLCKLHGLLNCLSCKDTFGLEDGPQSEEGWMLHRLVFDRAELDNSIRSDLQQLVVIDPKAEVDRIKRRAKQ